MTRSAPQVRTAGVRGALARTRPSWPAPVATDDGSSVSAPSWEDLWRWRLDRIRDALEQARTVLAHEGWTSGAWFAVREPSGGPRPVTTAEALALRDPAREVAGACLVGTLVRLAEDQDRPASVADVWGCVDELYEAMHEQLGHDTFPPGRAYPHEQRRAHLRALTAWNDAPGRTPEQVLRLVDRAVARTLG